jgi:hypothetical protein
MMPPAFRCNSVVECFLVYLNTAEENTAGEGWIPFLPYLLELKE